MPIFLIGFMASGKTTLGRALAERLPGRPFVDLDAYVEELEGLTVAELFATRGEAGFRAAESRALARVAGAPDAIVACGGGTPCRRENMDLMLASGTVVWLRASEEATMRRLLEAPAGQRPKIEKYRTDPEALLARVRELTEARREHYARAHAEFDSDRLESEAEIEATAALFISRFINNESAT